MEVSGLSFISNVPVNPIQLFTDWRSEAQQNGPNYTTNFMTLASIDDVDGVLSRNVDLRKVDDDGFIFVTERISKKYKNFKANPSVAVAFLWIYILNDTYIFRQIRATGTVTELSDLEIAKFYTEEQLKMKIRSKICPIGAPIVWNELKSRHDQVLKDYLEGKDKLLQNDSYTAMKIHPTKFDFYFARENEIADRVKYELKDGQWINYHIAT